MLLHNKAFVLWLCHILVCHWATDDVHTTLQAASCGYPSGDAFGLYNKPVLIVTLFTPIIVASNTYKPLLLKEQKTTVGSRVNES